MENKTGKYLKYAIGEILLVIIGILIAVSINGWNEKRKLKIEEQSILKDLKEEMTTNLKALEIVNEGNEKSLEATVKMRALFRDREAFNVMPDSVFQSISREVNMNWTYNPRYGILNSIISSGQINQLSNKELKYLLASIKEVTIDALENTRKIEGQRDDLMKTSYNNAIIIENGEINGMDHKSLFDDPTYRWATAHLFYFQRKDGLKEERELKKTLEQIIELINQEFDK